MPHFDSAARRPKSQQNRALKAESAQMVDRTFGKLITIARIVRRTKKATVLAAEAP
jgi:hypothetical protein